MFSRIGSISSTLNINAGRRHLFDDMGPQPAKPKEGNDMGPQPSPAARYEHKTKLKGGMN
jgi:hypothetical protein